MSTILIADDHPLFREALRGAVQRLLPEASLCEADSVDALYGLVEANPDADLLLLDLNMPGLSGHDLVRAVHTRHPALPILVLSMHVEASIAKAALDAGARSYLTKDQDPEVLLSATRITAQGGRFLDPKLAGLVAF